MNQPTFEQAYPDAYECETGAIWTSEEAYSKADWTYDSGDAFLEEVLGSSWQDAKENYASYMREKERKRFWKSHPRMRDAWWFVRRWAGAISMFFGTVFREWNEVRITPSLAWELASIVWLR
jgi:hypothetical protein